MGHPFGFFRRVPDLVPADPGLAIRVLGGLAFDPSGGLLFTAPLALMAVASAAMLWRAGGAGERAVLAGGVLTVLALFHSKEWYGGGSPPGRYLVPLLPAIALTWGMMLTVPRRWRRLAELLVVPSVLMWWTLVTRPHFSVNPGDGRWWLSDALARRFGADVQQFMPSFLVPTAATVWLPPVVIVLAIALVVASGRRPAVVVTLLRNGIALWLALAAALAAAVLLRHDVVVEAEAPQVRRLGGSPVPPAGTFSRFEHRRGWRVADREGIIVPLHLGRDAEVWIEGWLVGVAQLGARLEATWDDGQPTVLRVEGAAQHGRVRLPDPPGPGRRRLSVTLGAPPGGAAVFDRVVVVR